MLCRHDSAERVNEDQQLRCLLEPCRARTIDRPTDKSAGETTDGNRITNIHIDVRWATHALYNVVGVRCMRTYHNSKRKPGEPHQKITRALIKQLNCGEENLPSALRTPLPGGCRGGTLVSLETRLCQNGSQARRGETFCHICIPPRLPHCQFHKAWRWQSGTQARADCNAVSFCVYCFRKVTINIPAFVFTKPCSRANLALHARRLPFRRHSFANARIRMAVPRFGQDSFVVGTFDARLVIMRMRTSRRKPRGVFHPLGLAVTTRCSTTGSISTSASRHTSSAPMSASLQLPSNSASSSLLSTKSPHRERCIMAKVLAC